MFTPQGKILRYFLFAGLSLGSSSLFAQSLYLFGQIGKFPIAVSLQRDGETLSGWYFYASSARLIRLDGKIDQTGEFLIEESDQGKKTGMFSGTARGGRWLGTWQKPQGGAPLALALEENRDALKDWSGEYRCALQSRDSEYGHHYKKHLQLTVRGGAATKFKAVQSAVSEGDEQECSIALDDLQQIPAQTGLLLQAEADASAASGRKCTVRIIGGKHLLWVRFGDSAEPGNDCRGVEDTMYCSPRALWTDIVIDRGNGNCKALQ